MRRLADIVERAEIESDVPIVGIDAELAVFGLRQKSLPRTIGRTDDGKAKRSESIAFLRLRWAY